LGGDGVVTLTEIMDQTIVGIYWAYEGLRFWARRRGCSQIAAHTAALKGTKADSIDTSPLNTMPHL
jgi:hypothetical protein